MQYRIHLSHCKTKHKIKNLKKTGTITLNSATVCWMLFQGKIDFSTLIKYELNIHVWLQIYHLHDTDLCPRLNVSNKNDSLP